MWDNSKNFNPRTHKGATEDFVGALQEIEFQSTHPQGCDSMTIALFIIKIISIHAPTRVRHLRLGSIDLGNLFQSTHPQGCDIIFKYF